VAYSFEWDPKKAASNLKDHGVSFDEATTVFGDILAMNMPDPDHSEGEQRFLVLGMSQASRLVVVSYSERPPRARIISARLATGHERRTYENDQGEKVDCRCRHNAAGVRLLETAGRSTRRCVRLPGWVVSPLAQRFGTNGRHNRLGAVAPAVSLSNVAAARGSFATLGLRRRNSEILTNLSGQVVVDFGMAGNG